MGYKEYPTIDGLVFAPTTYALSPSPLPITPHETLFDTYEVGDPSVYRDPSSFNNADPLETYYMADDGSSNGAGGNSIGIATSVDGGRTFIQQYLSGAAHGALIAPDPGSNPNVDFGNGQPAVTYANGRWYMAYNDGSFGGELPPLYAPETWTIISSASPEFTNYTLALQD